MPAALVFASHNLPPSQGQKYNEFRLNSWGDPYQLAKAVNTA
jgi:hypothetical protein